MVEPDVARLRADARARALARPRVPFDGVVDDEPGGAVSTRRYTPTTATCPDAVVVFLHGGYGILGDLELQDGYCRRIAGILGVSVVSVDYRLAPEARLADSAADAVAVAGAVNREGNRWVVLWGDSAGGAVALAAARAGRADGLVLSNPNVDLGLARYDDAAPGGPGRELSEWAFLHWTGVGRLEDAPDLAVDAAGLPPVFVAVGSEDSLLPDAEHLVAQCAEAGVPALLREVPGASHGFMAGPDIETADAVIREAGRRVLDGDA
ncbi:alpha/beta hydrolase [Leifsonia sp. NPDC014704]|uniref:alpha/beta hydrolase n=1 Tax=Leifsonia sp. NPDC014704 TaxID=3364123 RepID=UPI0036F47FD5